MHFCQNQIQAYFYVPICKHYISINSLVINYIGCLSVATIPIFMLAIVAL